MSYSLSSFLFFFLLSQDSLTRSSFVSLYLSLPYYNQTLYLCFLLFLSFFYHLSLSLIFLFLTLYLSLSIASYTSLFLFLSFLNSLYLSCSPFISLYLSVFKTTFLLFLFSLNSPPLSLSFYLHIAAQFLKLISLRAAVEKELLLNRRKFYRGRLQANV